MNRDALKRTVLAGLFLLPFIPFPVSSSLLFPFVTTKAFAFRVIIEVIFAAWVVLALASESYRPKRSWLLYSILTFIAIIGAADAFGAAPLKSLWSTAERMEGFVGLVHLGMFYLVASSVLTATQWRAWWNTSLAASLIMVAYCAFQLAGVVEIPYSSGARIDGTLGNAGFLAVYLLFHIFVAMFLLVGSTSKNWKWFYLAAIVANAVILYFTATRGAILGAIGGLLIAGLLSLSNKQNRVVRTLSRAYVAGAAALVLAFFAFKDTRFVQESPVLMRFSTIDFSDWTNAGMQGRAFIWPMALQGIAERPVLGWGQENFNYVFNAYYAPAMANLEPWYDRAHNVFLDWAIAGGLPGLVSYLLLYLLLLCYLWRPASGFNSAERAALTGLVVAYSIHNFFVFDHLVSYVLFIGLLAFVDARVAQPRFSRAPPREGEGNVRKLATPAAAVALGAALYFVNVQPLVANVSLISALKNLRSAESIDRFKIAYGASRLIGRTEVVEQIVANAPVILNGALPAEDKDAFYRFAATAVQDQARDRPTDARYQKLAGDFFIRTGNTDRGMEYLNRAQVLAPRKQTIYFDLAAGQIAKEDFSGALVTLKQAFDLAPDYVEARVAYLIGAIFAGDMAKENELLASLTPQEFLDHGQDRIFAAYFQRGRYDKLISVLRDIQRDAPQYASQTEDLIREIRASAR